MGTTDRRDFLKRMAASTPGLLFERRVAGGQTVSPKMPVPKAVLYKPAWPGLSRFVDPLPMPMRLRPQSVRKDGVVYRLRMVEFKKRLHSELPPTRLWGYEG